MSTISKSRSLNEVNVNELFGKIEYFNNQLLPQDFVFANTLACDKV